MKEFQKKKKWKSIMSTKPFLAFLGIAILFFSYNMIIFIGKTNDTANNKRIVEERIKLLEETKSKLNTDLEKLKTDIGIEESIREKFGLAEEGEQMILIVDDQAQKTLPREPEEGFWTTIKGWFK